MATTTERPTAHGAIDRNGRRKRREQARERVLRSALALAESGPFRDLTVSEIARGAEISRSAFYTHYADKHELLVEALGEVADELQETPGRWWRGEGPPAHRVRRALEGIVSVYAEHAGVLRVAAEVSTYDDEIRGIWLGVIRGFIDTTADHIRAEQRANLIPRTLEAQPTSEGLTWMAERCCYVYLARGERTPEEVVEALAPVWTAALYPGVIPADELRPGELGSE